MENPERWRELLTDTLTLEAKICTEEAFVKDLHQTLLEISFLTAGVARLNCQNRLLEAGEYLEDNFSWRGQVRPELQAVDEDVTLELRVHQRSPTPRCEGLSRRQMLE